MRIPLLSFLKILLCFSCKLSNRTTFLQNVDLNNHSANCSCGLFIQMLQIVAPKNLWEFLQIAVLKLSFCKLIIKENILWQWIKFYYKLLQWIIFSKFGNLNIPVNVIFANLCCCFKQVIRMISLIQLVWVVRWSG